MTNPCGLLISAQGKDFDRAALLEHVRRAEYVTCSVLDGLQLAIDLHIPYAVFRDYTWEPQPRGNDQNAGWRAADEAFGQLVAWRKTHPGSENVLFMVNCERGFGVGVSWMYARLIQRCATEVSPPIGLVVGNWASGAVKCGQAGEPNAWIDAGEPLLRAMEKYGDVRLPNGSKAFVIGVHEYTAIHAWIAANGGRHQNTPLWKDRPTRIDWTLPQWHLGRMAQGVMAACKHFGIAQHPAMLVTECLFDTMNDVIDRLGPLKLAPSYDKPRGWRSLVPQWIDWYPGLDPAEVLADFHIWAWETVYAPLGFVVGTHTYLYERTDDPNWISFQVDEPDGRAYRLKMESWRPGVSTPTLPPQSPPPVVETVPVPVTPPVPGVVVVRTPGVKTVNLRSGPGATYPDIGDVVNGEEVSFWPDGVKDGWYPIRTVDGKEGWIASGAARVWGLEQQPLVVRVTLDGKELARIPVTGGAVAQDVALNLTVEVKPKG